MKDDRSILGQIEGRGHTAPRVDLDGIRRPGHIGDRYEILGELYRGALGVVYRGRDNDIGREVAIKVLREDLGASPAAVRRFVEEAQVGGQLQHPGILPVYELALCEDGRPYFAMRLAKGETLGVHLARRTDLAANQRALVTAFREVCRTLAYAHAHGVVHRDLKPSNLLLGSFGQVAVLEWGSARVLARGRSAGGHGVEKKAPDMTLISTVRTGDAADDPAACAAAGTPGYMSPEQALGLVESVGEQSDIYSLGAILCEILTGEPAQTGTDDERLAAARRGNSAEPQARLAACGANEKLVEVCRQCLEPAPKDRPKTAEAVADAVAAALTASEGNAHRAQLRALKVKAQAEEQRRSRRLTVVTSSLILGAIALGGGVLLLMDADRTTRERERRAAVEAATRDAARLSAAARWDEALAAAGRAIDLGEDRALYAQIESERQQLTDAARRTGADQAFLAELEAQRDLYGVRALADPSLTPEAEDLAVDAAYAEAFRQRFGSVIESREGLATSKKAPEFSACLGFWSSVRRGSVALRPSGWKALHSVACEVDPKTAEAREAIASVEADGLFAAATQRGDALPTALAAEVGLRLVRLGRARDAVGFLTPWQGRHPDDYWINVQLAAALSAAGDAQRAVRYAFGAVAVRPANAAAWIRLGLYHKQAGNFVDAIYSVRRAGELDPGQELTTAALRAIEAAKADRDAGGG